MSVIKQAIQQLTSEEHEAQQKGDSSLARDFVSPARGFAAAGQTGGPDSPFLGSYYICSGHEGFSSSRPLIKFRPAWRELDCCSYH